MADDRPLYVLCDTNAAARDAHLFQKKGGPQLVALLRAKKAKLLVPDVLRMEYVNQFAKSGDEVRQKAVGELDKLKTLCGFDISALLPKPDFGETQALKILERLEDVIHRIPTTPELKVAAADRSINCIRPTSKSDHGYKDCLIWESLLTLPKGSEVILLSRDEAAFFDGLTLASGLQKEAEEKGILLTAYNTKKIETLWPLVTALSERFADIAASVTGDLPVDDHPIIQAYMQSERVAPVLPQDPTEIVSLQVVVQPGELEELFANQLRPLMLHDIKAFGFVSYLRNTGKQDVIALLGQSGVATEAARNALERLALAGLIRDTGHNYLTVEGRLADMSAQQVEAEMIKLTGLGS